MHLSRFGKGASDDHHLILALSTAWSGYYQRKAGPGKPLIY
jgi:hypothetical protein